MEREAMLASLERVVVQTKFIIYLYYKNIL